MHCSTTHPSPVGKLTLACDEGGGHLVGLWLEGQKYFGGAVPGELHPNDDMPVFDRVKEWLDGYFAGDRPSMSHLPLAPIGSEFRQCVWRMLCDIPYGQVVTYGDIARRMAAAMNRPSMSGQAAGGAVGHNPISIIIPCHRVVGADGSLTGYAGGVATKARLLEWEGVNMSRLHTPKRGTAL